MRMLTLFLSLLLIVSTQARAYDGLEADFATCSQGQDRTEIIAACTRLIDNAEAENAVTGMFYGIRASNNDDKVQNCKDARKSFDLADDETLKALSQQLIDANC